MNRPKLPGDNRIDEDERRLCSNPEFIQACLLIMRGLEESTLDLDKVKKVRLGVGLLEELNE